VIAPVRLRIRRALLRCVPKAVVLNYHRVADLPGYPYRLVVEPGRFEQHMLFLKRHYRLISMGELVAFIGEGRIPPLSVVVTFDDGYADVFENALPILTRHDIPATVFIISGAVGDSGELWWDRLERVASAACNGGEETIALDGGSPEDSWVIEPGTKQQKLRNIIRPRLLQLSNIRQRAVLDQWYDQLGLKATARPEHRFMSQQEVEEMAKSPGIEIGAHTVSHPHLAAFPVEKQTVEIRGSRETLRAITGQDVEYFSYPYGGAGTYSQETIHAVADAGFVVGCTTYHEPVLPGSPILEMARCNAHNWDVSEFHRRLDGFFLSPVCPRVGTGGGVV